MSDALQSAAGASLGKLARKECPALQAVMCVESYPGLPALVNDLRHMGV